MSEHTPGPWILRYHERVTRADDTDGTKSIAHIYPTRNITEGEANRRLIAAAPDMFDALEAVLSEIVLPGHLAEVVEAALAKAEGK